MNVKNGTEQKQGMGQIYETGNRSEVTVW